MQCKKAKNKNPYFSLQSKKSRRVQGVNSTSTTYNGKINYTFSTQGSSVSNIVITNRSFSQYKQLISNKFGAQWNTVVQTSQGPIEIIQVGGTKYVARPFASSPNFNKTVEYWRNGVKIGEFRFND